MKRTKGKINEKGFSLIEALVTLLILSVIIIMLYELMIGSLRASLFVESRNDLEVFAQRTVNSIQSSLVQSRLVYAENTQGPGYRTLLINSGLGSGVIFPDSRLPTIDSSTNAVLEPDTGAEVFVGNSIIIVRAMEPVPIPFNDGTENLEFLADRYRLEYYYLKESSARNFNASGRFIDLIKTETQDFVDYFQLSSIPLAQLTQITTALRALPEIEDLPGGLPAWMTTEQFLRLEIDGPIDIAWNPTEPATTAFYNFDDAGTFTQDSTPALVLNSTSMLPEFSGGRVSGKMEYTVCMNSNTALANGKFGPLGIQDEVPLFGIIDDLGGTGAEDFPSGLEFKIVGPSGARSVWNRLVLCSEHMQDLDSQESVMISSTREF